MKIKIDMPWERDLTVNHSHFGAKGAYRRKPHVQDWMSLLSELIVVERLVAIAEGRYPPHINIPVYIKIDMRFPDKRRRDPQNYHKAISDAVSTALRIDDQDFRMSTGSVARGVGREAAGFTIEVSDERS